MEYKEKLKELQFNLANSFLNEKTLNFGNRTVITSSLLILISLNFLTIKEIEFEGLTVGINVTILTIVILLINIYYYKQFDIAREIDDSSFSAPQNYLDFEKELPLVSKPFQEKIEIHTNEVLEVQNKIKNGTVLPQELEQLSIRLPKVIEELESSRVILQDTIKAVKSDSKKAEKFAILVNKYNTLNSNFPKIMYYIGLFCVILRFIVDTTIIFKTKTEPFKYIFQENYIYIQKIFEK